MKPGVLVYTTTAKLTRPTGGDAEAWREISVTLPWLSIFRNDPAVPKPRRLNQKPRKRLSPPDDRQAERIGRAKEAQVKELWDQGVTMPVITAATGLGESAVNRIKERLDLPKRPHRPSRYTSKANACP